eukprot:CAMPEP_0177780146 /NCGR_PEP_ID=MMETSP0491_2-20121128/17032_1 /TAXON_ID=63592 /ORGANISM="Tetraselmis chuii, Strain PLY429" /LENGTH=176 /DNA_ID=CAMNT_0019299867 /DNA_START=822 /DNA_END=1352 /DNA_ORIENTATION=+
MTSRLSFPPSAPSSDSRDADNTTRSVAAEVASESSAGLGGRNEVPVLVVRNGCEQLLLSPTRESVAHFPLALEQACVDCEIPPQRLRLTENRPKFARGGGLSWCSAPANKRPPTLRVDLPLKLRGGARMGAGGDGRTLVNDVDDMMTPSAADAALTRAPPSIIIRQQSTNYRNYLL